MNGHYQPGSVIWDVFPEEFTFSGNLQEFIDLLSKQEFSMLVEEEKKRVEIFLDEWERQLNEVAGESPSKKRLQKVFEENLKLSGVLYFSHNTVLSEAIFDTSLRELSHITERVLGKEPREGLSCSERLSFSFPRAYFFEGFSNSWGFLRVETKKCDSAIALSVTTLDPEIMALMRDYKFQHLASLYNQVWNFAIHDYIHHIALYTNPSFAVGKTSPMSLLGLEKGIDAWGEDMMSTFNYEYWAHRTHRMVTRQILSPFIPKILTDAKKYFSELKRIQQVLITSQEVSEEYLERVSLYLACIYLWPLHILLHPFGEEMKELRPFIDNLHLPLSKKKEVILIREIQKNFPSQNDLSPRACALRETFASLGISLENSTRVVRTLRPYELVCLQTDLVVQRGMYECWHHDSPVQFQGKDIDPRKAALKFLQIREEVFEKLPSEPSKHRLYGIATQLQELSEV